MIRDSTLQRDGELKYARLRFLDERPIARFKGVCHDSDVLCQIWKNQAV